MPSSPSRDAATKPPTRKEALRAADDLLWRLNQWDMLSPSATIPLADAPYWKGEIARVRAIIAEAERFANAG